MLSERASYFISESCDIMLHTCVYRDTMWNLGNYADIIFDASVDAV